MDRTYDPYWTTHKRDIDGATLRRLVIKAQERRAKQPIIVEQDAEKPKSNRWWWVGIGLIASYFGIQVLVAVIKAVLR